MKKKLIYLLISFSLLLGIGYFGYTLINSNDIMANMFNIVNSLILCIFTIVFMIIGIKVTNHKVTLYIPVGSIILSILISFNLLSAMNIIALQKETTIDNFVNSNVTDVLNWASSNNIEVKQVYDYSDIVPEFYIISQNINEGTSIDEVDILELVISQGPNLDKIVIVPNMLGWKVDDVVKFINENFLQEVAIEFEFSEEERDVVIEQDKNGELRRNEPIAFTFSLGNVEDLHPVELIDLTNKPLLEATIWLKRHGLKYELEYKFDKKVKRNHVIKQNIEIGQVLGPTADTGLIITISKGKEIVVPNLIKMDIQAIINWVAENKLKISFDDRYDEKIEIGGIIEVNHQKEAIIEEGTLIHIVTSRGQLKTPTFKTLYEFREWANKYGIALEEIYEFSDSLAKGEIIKLSHDANTIISNNDKIIITVSQGKAVTIPSFNGRTRSQATTLCNSSGLKCSFRYGSYSASIAKDNVTAQSRASGARVVQGTSIVLTLSKGKAQVFDFVIQASWLAPGNADSTIASLKKEFASRYPDVTFNFVKHTHNSLNAGYIHPDSPTNNGKPNTVEQGRSYTIWVVN